jgi:hypothetical protein
MTPAEKLRRAIWDRVVWYTDQRRLLRDSASSERWALLAVIGREWYQERTKFYNIRNKPDLQKVLRLEAGGNPRLQFVIGALEGDGYRVTFYELHRGCDLDSLKALCWIPESWLLSRRLSDREIVTVERQGLRYFQSGDGSSQLAGGVVTSSSVFALARGLPEANLDRSLGFADLQSELLAAASCLSWRDALVFRAPTLPAEVWLLARPAAIVFSVTLIGYLAFAAAWLEGMYWWRSKQLERYGSDVAALVDLQREIGVLSHQQAKAAEVFSNRPYSIEIWQLVAEVWKRNGVLKSVSFENGRVSFIGMAPVATEVLQGLSEHSLVQSAQFTSPVRESRGAQDFSIAIELKGGSTRD